MIFILTPTKLKRKKFFVALRINKIFTFYCDKLLIETKKSQLHTLLHSTHFRYVLERFLCVAQYRPKKNAIKFPLKKIFETNLICVVRG